MESNYIAAVITILIWVLGLSFACGVLWEKVRGNCKDIEANRNENREAHKQIYDKLSDLTREMKIRNGNHG